MPAVARRRTVAAPVDAVWTVVSNPYHRPRWWPSVERVEDVEGNCWTDVVRSKRGRFVRADFTRFEEDPPRGMRWRLEIEDTPFERLVAGSEYELTLEPAAEGATQIELRARQTLRGGAKATGLMARRATGRQLEEALAALERILAGPPAGEDAG